MDYLEGMIDTILTCEVIKMSVYSKMFVTCGEDKFSEVIRNIISDLKYTTCVTYGDDYWIKDLSVHSRDFNSFCMDFDVYNDANLTMETRSLFISSVCSCDHSHIYEGDKIVFSIGRWGHYDFVMTKLAETLKRFGKVYYDFDDSDDKDFVELFTE